MNSFLKNYKALIIGGIMTIFLAIVLSVTNFILFDPAYVSINIFVFIFLWLFLSFLINKFPIYKILGLVGLLIAAPVADSYLKAFNPISIPLLILFWLGIAYLILPQFFKKYKISILSVYGVVLSYFFFFRMMPNYVENHHQNFLSFLLIPIPVFAALWLYEQWRWLKTLQADKGKTELALLKSQINPHFFFNTLNNLYSLTIKNSDKAPVVILKLSEMMRYTIYEGKKDAVPLKDVITYLNNYIDLHEIRYHKSVNIQFKHTIKDSDTIAPLLFIILLENAFKHGIETLTENAFITINLTSNADFIHFTIENNFDPSDISEEKGIGLDNLKRRLALIYPKKHILSISQDENIYKADLKINKI